VKPKGWRGVARPTVTRGTLPNSRHHDAERGNVTFSRKCCSDYWLRGMARPSRGRLFQFNPLFLEAFGPCLFQISERSKGL
jgi:hypothetical protein